MKINKQNEAKVKSTADKYVNSFTNDVLTGVDPVMRDENGKSVAWEVNFSRSNITSQWKLWAMKAFVELLDGWDDAERKTLVARKGTIRNWHVNLLRIAVWASENKPLIAMSSWSETDLANLFQDAIENKIFWSDRLKADVLSYGTLTGLVDTLNVTRELYYLGRIYDGCVVPTTYDFLSEAAKPVLIRLDMEYEKWKKRKVVGSVPLVVFSILVQRAIDVIRRPYTLFFSDLMALVRARGINIENLFGKRVLVRYCSNEPMNLRTKTIEDCNQVVLLLNKHNIAIDENLDLGVKELSKKCDEVFDACILIILALTGIRVSELLSISGDDYSQNPDGTWVFNSEIIKTNHGISEARQLSGLTLEAAKLMVNCSLITKKDRADKKRIPLLLRAFNVDGVDKEKDILRAKKSRVFTSEGIRLLLIRLLEDVFDEHPEMKELSGHIHPHMFRHTWAEFALRRFEGDVFEAIRRHFMHSYSSYFTTTYTFNKLNEKVKNDIERKYLREIIERIARDNIVAKKDLEFSKDITGKVVSYLDKAMSVTIVEDSELFEFVESIADEFESLNAHEYGYCLVRKGTRTLAKCYDRKTQTPLLENGCFSLCLDCVNYAASCTNNKNMIIRTAVSHQNMIESQERLWGKNIKSKAVESSRKIVKQAERVLNAMEVQHV